MTCFCYVRYKSVQINKHIFIVYAVYNFFNKFLQVFFTLFFHRQHPPYKKTTRCGSDIIYIPHSYVQIKNNCSRTHLLSIKTPQTQKVAFFFKLLRVALLDTTPSQNLKCTLYVHCYANMSKCILFYYYCKKYVKLCLD